MSVKFFLAVEAAESASVRIMSKKEPVLSSACDEPTKKQTAILEAATSAFLRFGYRAASMDAVARQAGVAKQTIYNHFGSKEALFGAVVERRCENLLTVLLTPGIEARGVAGALTSLARQYVELMLSPTSLALHRVLMGQVRRHPELGAVSYEAGGRPAVDTLSVYLSERTAAGELDVAEPTLAAEQFYGMLAGHIQVRALLGVEERPSAETVERTIRHAVDTFLRAFAVDATGRRAVAAD